MPVYLVLDMQVQEITVFWDPSPKGYRSRTTVPFGEPVHVPAPFDFDLDTSSFSTVRPDAASAVDSTEDVDQEDTQGA